MYQFELKNMAFIFSNIGVLTFCRLMTSKCVLKQTVKTKIKCHAMQYFIIIYFIHYNYHNLQRKENLFMGWGGRIITRGSHVIIPLNTRYIH